MDISRLQSDFKSENYQGVVDALTGIDGVLPEQAYRLKGNALQKLRKFEAAMEVWDLALSNYGDHPDYYAERGVCKFHLRFKSSMDDLNMAIELDPENGYRYACRAYVRDKIGDTEGAVEDYRKANELDPGNEITLNNLGLAEDKLGYTKSARGRFLQADEIAGISAMTNKYFQSEETTKEIEVKEKSTVLKELRKMLSSKTEFSAFLKEARELFRKNR